MQKLLLAVCAVLILPAWAMAQCDCCPECGTEIAVGLLKKTKEKVKVYEVEQKEIVVPKICMPKPLFNLKQQICNLIGKPCCPGKPCGPCEIEDCPKHVRNGCIKTIKVLKKKTVECTACAYEWEITDIEKVNEYLYGPVESLEKEPEGAAVELTPAEPENQVELKPAEPENMELETVPEAPVDLVPPPAAEVMDKNSTSSRSWILRKIIRKLERRSGFATQSCCKALWFSISELTFSKYRLQTEFPPKRGTN